MEEFFQEMFKNADGELSKFQLLASKYLPVLVAILVALIVIHFIMIMHHFGIFFQKVQ